MKLDLEVWNCFLSTPKVFCRPFVDYSMDTPYLTDFHTDASGNYQLGAGGHCKGSWFILQWDEDLLNRINPSIGFLELYALTVGIKLWLKHFKNKRITIFCDNMSVVHMINNNSSSCPKCMVLIRIIVLESLLCNTRVFACHVPMNINVFADHLSRLRYDLFRKEARRLGLSFRKQPEELPAECVADGKSPAKFLKSKRLKLFVTCS